MRVCVTGLRGFPNVMGGIETHCEHIYTAMLGGEDPMEVSVLARSPYVGSSVYEYAGLKIVPLWTVRNKFAETILHTLISVIYARFSARADILHIHAIGPGLMAPVARGLGLRVVATHHGHDYERLKWGGIARAALRLGEWCMVQAADSVICVSEGSARKLRATYPRRAHKVHHIPNGAAVAGSTPTDRSVLDELRLADRKYILAVGRLVPEKGFQDLIAAAQQADIELPVVIVGAADHADAFSRELLAQESDRIRFGGLRRPGELAVLYRHASLFVLPSYHEGHPIAALEALSAGAPMMLSDIDANREIGLEARHYFPLGNVKALAEMLSSTNYEHLRPSNEEVVAKFSWARIAHATAAVIRTSARAAPQ